MPRSTRFASLGRQDVLPGCRGGPASRLGVSLADGFAIATAERLGAELASFDQRVRRALEEVGAAAERGTVGSTRGAR